jgi:hypothetical protein
MENIRLLVTTSSGHGALRVVRRSSGPMSRQSRGRAVGTSQICAEVAAKPKGKMRVEPNEPERLLPFELRSGGKLVGT